MAFYCHKIKAKGLNMIPKSSHNLSSSQLSCFDFHLFHNPCCYLYHALCIFVLLCNSHQEAILPCLILKLSLKFCPSEAVYYSSFFSSPSIVIPVVLSFSLMEPLLYLWIVLGALTISLILIGIQQHGYSDSLLQIKNLSARVI